MASSRVNPNPQGYSLQIESDQQPVGKSRLSAIPAEEVKDVGSKISPPKTSRTTIKQRLASIWQWIVNFFCCRRGSDNQDSNRNRTVRTDDENPHLDVPSMADDHDPSRWPFEPESHASLHTDQNFFDTVEETSVKAYDLPTSLSKPVSEESPLAGRLPLDPLTINTDDLSVGNSSLHHHSEPLKLVIKTDSRTEIPQQLASRESDPFQTRSPDLPCTSSDLQHSPTVTRMDVTADVQVPIDEEMEDGESTSTEDTVKEKSDMEKSDSQDLFLEMTVSPTNSEEGSFPFDGDISVTRDEPEFTQEETGTVTISVSDLSADLDRASSGGLSKESGDSENQRTLSFDGEYREEYSPLLSRPNSQTDISAVEVQTDEVKTTGVIDFKYATQMSCLDEIFLKIQNLKELLGNDKTYNLLDKEKRQSLLKSIEELAGMLPEKEGFEGRYNLLQAFFEGTDSKSETITYTNALHRLFNVLYMAIPAEIEGDSHLISNELRQLKSAIESLNIRWEPNQDENATEETSLLKPAMPACIQLSSKKLGLTVDLDDNDSDGEEDIFVADIYRGIHLTSADLQSAAIMPPKRPQSPVITGEEKGFLSITPEETEVPTDSMNSDEIDRIQTESDQAAQKAKDEERLNRGKQPKHSRIPTYQQTPKKYSLQNGSSPHPSMNGLNVETNQLWDHVKSRPITRRKSEGEISVSLLSDKSTHKAKSYAGDIPRTQDKGGWTQHHQDRQEEHETYRKKKSEEKLPMGFGSRVQSKVKLDPNTFIFLKQK